MPSEKDIVQEARELLAKISPWPWSYQQSDGFIRGLGHCATVAQTWSKLEEDFNNAEINGKFIARTPELLRALADEVERLREIEECYNEAVESGLILDED